MCRILYRFLALLAVRNGRSKDLEIIVLRNQLSMLRRHNHHRRHTLLDNLSPIRYQQRHQPAAQVA